jgi:hypothetical protein
MRVPSADHFGDGTDEVLRDVDDELLDRLRRLAIDLLGDHFRPRDLELIPFAAHGLNQNRQMQLATTGHRENIRLIGGRDPEREVGFQLAEQPLAELPGRGEASLAAGEGRRIHSERQLERRLFDPHGRQRLRGGWVRQCRADPWMIDASQCHDIAGLGLLYRALPKALELR